MLAAEEYKKPASLFKSAQAYLFQNYIKNIEIIKKILTGYYKNFPVNKSNHHVTYNGN